ncbi:MAG: anthrone oxygenase family protein [Pseudomonadota bacterium]
MSIWFFILTQSAVLAYALVGGVFLAFSDFVMRSLAHTGGTGGVEAMQVINREVFRWVFMALFLGMAPLSLGLALYGGLFVAGLPGALLVAAGLVYFIGCFGVTVVRNVPMNTELAGMDKNHAETRQYWTNTYVPRWTFWNSVRTSACVASAVLLLFAIFWTHHAHAV